MTIEYLIANAADQQMMMTYGPGWQYDCDHGEWYAFCESGPAQSFFHTVGRMEYMYYLMYAP